MDLKESQPLPLQAVPPPQEMMFTAPTPSYGADVFMINPNQTSASIAQPSPARFTYGAISLPQDSRTASDSMNSGGDGFDGSQLPFHNVVEPSPKKKRGRPRKYNNDGNAVLQLLPTTLFASASDDHSDSASIRGNSGEATPTDEPSPKRARGRGRPLGSGKKELDSLGGTGGVGLTPHVIIVEAGEDIASKIIEFSQQGLRTVCILSANGVICSVTLRENPMSSGTVTYNGMFEILSLSGSCFVTETNGDYTWTCGLNVMIGGAAQDGLVKGGAVAGMLRAALPVQVIVGSFVAGGKKQNPCIPKPSPPITPQVVNSLSAVASVTTPSHGASSVSDDENGSSSPDRGSGFYNNPAPSLHNSSSQMYHQMWPNRGPQ